MKSLATMILVALFMVTAPNCKSSEKLHPRSEYQKTLVTLAEALYSLQIRDHSMPDAGAIRCKHCSVLHTRAAEAVFPFAVAFQVSANPKFLEAAINLGNWLVRQQQPDGSWKETPEEWTGTTTDQLLMMLLTYDKIGKRLSPSEQGAWTQSIAAAAAYLNRTMSHEFASVNYCATTAATLAYAHQLLGNPAYLAKALTLAHRTVAKMDQDGFINGEGGKSYQNKFGVDLGYDMEMSLWGLGLYARVAGDTLVDHAVRRALPNHLWFIYPDGSMDNSWGIRSNKWTTYGGATSDGCQILFALYGDADPRYAAASLKNLEYLAKSMKDGLVGYGPHYWKIFSEPPCIYPTFAKAKNVAMAYVFETMDDREPAELPTARHGWLKHFKTLDVALVRTSCFMATVTAYRYKDVAAGTRSKYMYRPTGGALSALWLQDDGYLQASSQTVYSRPEPMHFPEIGEVRCLTPQITFSDSNGTFTNLYEFDGTLGTQKIDARRFAVVTTGELKDAKHLHGGIGYRLAHTFADSAVTKAIDLTYRDAMPIVNIIEPIIDNDGTVIERVDGRTLLIQTRHHLLEFAVVQGEVELVVGREKEKYYSPYPALRAVPVELRVSPPAFGFTNRIQYRIAVIR
jgi:hypothetical protein